MKTLKDLDIKGKRVLVRCDFNVPLDERGLILDDFRIQKAVPTINYIIDQGAGAVLMTHLDDPGGIINERLRVGNIAKRLEYYLKKEVTKADDCIGEEINEMSFSAAPGKILLLENLRFHKEEEAGDLDFARKLSESGDIFVNDAFACSHRPHASIIGVPNFLPSFAGFLLEKEIEILDGFLGNPERPVIAIVGGTKVKTKAKFIEKLLEIADSVLVGGPIKKEIEDEKIIFKNEEKIIGPTTDILDFDISNETAEIFRNKILGAKTVLWNGPLGRTEDTMFTRGSAEVAKAIIDSKAFSIVGGGDTVEFINRLGTAAKFNHVSTGGGAMLAYVAGEKLPGIEVLR